MKNLTRSMLFCLVALLVAGPAIGQVAEVMPYQPNPDKNTADRVADMAATYQYVSSFAGADKGGIYDVQISVAELNKLASTVNDGGPLLAGVHGPVDFSYDPYAKQSFGTTSFSDGMQVWTGTFRSLGATGVRLQLKDLALPKGAEMYAFDDFGQAYGPYTGFAKDFWTNTLKGDTLYLQVHLPLGLRGEAASDKLFQVVQLAHMGDNYEFGHNPDKAFCSWNDSCITNAECASIPSAIQPLQDAVAYMIFPVGSQSFICTGGLLNDTSSSGTPYFLTANHCLSTTASATGLETYFQWTVGCGASCGSQFNPPGSVPVVNGATLLATNSSTDFTFLELNSAAPSGSVFLGWTTSAVANSGGTNLFRVSHPAGSPQAYSEQSVNATAGTCGTLPRGNFIYSDATLADTEGGSSGSPVVNSSNQVVGQLFGACGATPSTTCDNDDRTVDGAFAVTYSSIESWLTGSGGGGGGGGGSCTGNNVWTGTASSSSSSLVTPNCSGGGSFTGELVCDTGAADLDLYLDKQSCSGWFGCSFSAVASSTSANCDENVSTSSSSGTFRWRVTHYSGPAEDFTLCTNQC